jgi:CARDB/FG-GAP-like repeat/Bacterial pre-peptidase C-terminal domain
MPENPNNNTFATATVITGLKPAATILSGTLSPTDLTDYYKFSLASSGNVSVSLTGLTGNARIRLFSESTGTATTPTELAGVINNNPANLSEYVTRELAIGTYYIQIERDPAGATNTTATDYTVGVSALVQAGADVNPFIDWRQQKNNISWRDQATGDAGFWQMSGTTYVNPQTRNIPLEWKQIGVGDTNGDGQTDIFWLNTLTNELGVWLMNGTTFVSSNVIGTPPKDWQVAGFYDFNADGKTDVLWRRISTTTTTDELGIWLMDGLSFSATGSFTSVPKDWQIVGAADFNGDRRADLLWSNKSTGGEVAIWLMNGITRIDSRVLRSIPTIWEIQGIGDTNNDGRADLFFRNTTTGENALWLINGVTIVSEALLPTVPVTWRIEPLGQTNANRSLADFNNDGKADLLWRNTQTGQTAVWLLDGLTRAAQAAYDVPTSWKVEAAGDYNLDGRTDLLWRDQTTGDVATWLMNGTTILAQGFTLRGLVSNWQTAGGTLTPVAVQPLSISGGTATTAFNIGTLNAQGLYSDVVEPTRPDWFRFNLNSATFFTMSSLPGTTTSPGQPGTRLDLYSGTTVPTSATPPIAYTAGMRLQAGIYYVRLSALGPTDVNYGLTIKGEPVAVNLTETTEVLVPTSIVLDQRTLPTDPLPPGKTLRVDSTIRNTGNDAVGAFSVRYYLSRDNVFDASDLILGTRNVATLGFTTTDNTTLLTNNFTLPDGENAFWTVDKDYFVITRIDQENAITETNETDNDRITALPVSNTLRRNLLGTGLTVLSATVTPTGVLQIRYSVTNNGNGSSPSSEARFWLSADQTIDTSPAGGDFDLGFADVPTVNGVRSAPDNVYTATLNVPLPTKIGWSGWSSLSGNQTFYIGMVQDVTDADVSDNLNRGLGLDLAAFTVNLG